MGMNTSRAKQVSMAEDRRIGALARYVLPGWSMDVERNRILAVPTLLGALQRGQTIIFSCRRRDCGRRVEPDLEALVRSGHGHIAPAELEHRLRCHYPLGCELRLVSETYPRGVPLVDHVGDATVLISLRCNGCGLVITRSPEETIDRLKAARRGDGSTGLLELGSKVRGPCRACKGRAFTSGIERLPAKMGLG